MYQVFALISLFLSVQATVASKDHDHTLLRRDVCDGINDMPVLYHNYLTDVCRPKYFNSSEGFATIRITRQIRVWRSVRSERALLMGRSFPWALGAMDLLARLPI